MITIEDYKEIFEWKWIDKNYLKNLILESILTPEQYKEITGDVYAA